LSSARITIITASRERVEDEDRQRDEQQYAQRLGYA